MAHAYCHTRRLSRPASGVARRGGRVRFIWAYLVPGRAYIEACYPGRATWQLPFLYLHRLWRETVQIIGWNNRRRREYPFC